MHKDESIFAEAGIEQELQSNIPLILGGDLRAWRLEHGRLDVFAVKVRDGEIVSRRRFIASFEPGSFFFSIGADTRELDEEATLIAVPAMGTVVRELEEDLLQGAVWDDEKADVIGKAVDGWVDQICGGVFRDMPPKQHVEPEYGGGMVLEEGAHIRRTEGVAWVALEEGAVHLLGRRNLPVVEGSDTCFPVSAHIWYQTCGVCRLQAVSSLQRAHDGEIWSDLGAFHALIRSAIEVAAASDVQEGLERLTKKDRADRAAFASALGRLASVMSERSEAVVGEVDSLTAACRLIGDECGIAVTAPSEAEGADRRDRLGRIARASRFRTRNVALRGEWWKGDSGPLLGLLVSENDGSRSPVALLPYKSGGYRLINPTSGEAAVVDEAVNERLHPYAYAFYRPFGHEALSAWKVFKFGAEQCLGDFWMILLMGIGGGLLGLLTPIITGFIFNRVIPGAERIQLVHMVAALLVCAVTTSLFQMVRGLAVLRVESKMDASVQSAVWDRLLNLPTSFFRRFAAGELAMRAGGISAIRQLLSGAAISSLLSGLFSVCNLALLFYYDAGLALWALGMTVLTLMIMLVTSYGQLRYQREVTQRQARLSGEVLQYVTGITKLRVAGAETKAFDRWARSFTGQRRLQYKARRLGNVLAAFVGIFPIVSMMVIFGIMVGRVDAVMSTGDFIAFNGAFGTFTANMLGMTSAFVAILMAIPIYEQARPILETLPEIDDTMADPGSLSGDIEIEHVSFRYDPEGADILRDVSIRARPGEFVALVGPSGSGKSTILRLLLGFEEAESGSIYYDGQDLSGLDVQAARRQIGVVLQNGGLMTGDLFTNITGSSLATMDDAWQAARMAGFDDDIRKMPMGMHSVISEGGTTLSGGQRQRLLIARAVVNRPRIVFFDEATSALDNRTQAIVSKSLDRLQATRIVVAHRLSTIMNADRIYVLDQGRVVQQGTYASLLNEGGLFGELVRRQIV